MFYEDYEAEVDTVVHFGSPAIDLDLLQHWLRGDTIEQVVALWCHDDEVWCSDSAPPAPRSSRTSSDNVDEQSRDDATTSTLTQRSAFVLSDSAFANTFAPATLSDEAFDRRRARLVRSYVDGNYNLFHQLEKYLAVPSSLSHQSPIQLPSFIKCHLVEHYYAFDAPIMREILNRSKAIATHKPKDKDFRGHACLRQAAIRRREQAIRFDRSPVDGRSGAQPLNAAVAVRQYNNVRKLLKKLDSGNSGTGGGGHSGAGILPAPSMAYVLLHDFRFPAALARDYAAVLFLTYHRFDLKRSSLAAISYQALADCAREMLSNWTCRYLERHASIVDDDKAGGSHFHGSLRSSQPAVGVARMRGDGDASTRSSVAMPPPPIAPLNSGQRSLSDLEVALPSARPNSSRSAPDPVEPRPFITIDGGPDLHLDPNFVDQIKELRFVQAKPIIDAVRDQLQKKYARETNSRLIADYLREQRTQFADMCCAIMRAALSLHHPQRLRTFFSDVVDGVVVPLVQSQRFANATEVDRFLLLYMTTTEELNEFRIQGGSELRDVWRRLLTTISSLVVRLYVAVSSN